MENIGIFWGWALGELILGDLIVLLGCHAMEIYKV